MPFRRNRCVARAWKNFVFSSPSLTARNFPRYFQWAAFFLIASASVSRAPARSARSGPERVRDSSKKS